MYHRSILALLVVLATVSTVALAVSADASSSSSTAAPSLSSTPPSSTGTVPPTPTVAISWVTGCAWLSPSGALYGCNADSSLPLSRATLHIDRVDLLPPDWELAVYGSNVTLRGADSCTVFKNSTMNCRLPPMSNRGLWGTEVGLWLQGAQNHTVSSTAITLVYAAPPFISSVTGCGFVNNQLQTTWGCNLPSPLLTVLGSGFSRAWDGGLQSGSPVYFVSSTSAYQCVVSSLTDGSIVCSDIQPHLRAADNNGIPLRMTVMTGPGQFVSNVWDVQVISDSSPSAPPHIDGVWGGGCSSWDNFDRTGGCLTNYATLFTISGSGFNTPSSGNSLVQMMGTQTGLTYTCVYSQLSETTIVCNGVQPTMDSRDSGSVFRVSVETVKGRSNVWNVQITDNGPYNPSSRQLAGMDPSKFIAVISIVGVVAVLALSLAVLSCCCGVKLASIARCCCSRSSSFSSPNDVQSASAGLLVAAPDYAGNSSSTGTSTSSQFRSSIVSNSTRYPMVYARSDRY